MAYVHADNAVGPAASPRSAGGPTVTLAGGKGAAFAAASPSPTSPMPVGIFRGPSGSEAFLGAVLVTAVSGDQLSCTGLSGYVDPAVQIGDVVACVPLAADDAALWAAIATCVTSSALATMLGSYATTASLSAYATTSALTSGLAGKQATLTAGSISTSLLAAGAVSYAKLQDAAGAGVLGAGAAGAHQLLTLDDSVAITAGVIRARGLVLLGRWRTPTDVSASTGLMSGASTAPAACTPYLVLISAPTNPSGVAGGATVQVKVGGVDLLTTAAALAAGSTAVLDVASGFAVGSIAYKAQVQPSLSAIGSDVRGLLVEVWGRLA